MIYIPVIYSVAHSQCNSPEIESSSIILEVWSLWPPGHQELLKNCTNWLSWWIFIFHVDIHSPAIPCPISLLFFSIHDLKLRTNEFVYDGMLCFPLNPYHCHVVLFTGLPTQPRFGFCMHNFWISPMYTWSPASWKSGQPSTMRLCHTLDNHPDNHPLAGQKHIKLPALTSVGILGNDYYWIDGEGSYGSCGQHGAHLGPTGPRWAPCWPLEPCYLGKHICLCS